MHPDSNKRTPLTTSLTADASSNLHELVGDELYPLPLLLGQESRIKGWLAGLVPLAWKVLIVVALLLGARYLFWRWTASLNEEVWLLSLTMVMAESLAFLGVALLFYNLWDKPRIIPASAPVTWRDCAWSENGDDERDDQGAENRPISVDIFITTYNEPAAILDRTVQAALAVHYPYKIRQQVWLLDDGNRPEIAALAGRHKVGYIGRTSNEGYKAGNLDNALRQTSADFFVICDADTELFPNFLTRTLGYFRDRKVAWVQAPHWFPDTPKGRSLKELLMRRGGFFSRWLLSQFPRACDWLRFGKDPLQMDQHIFFNNIMGPRNRHNAAFCCGAASIHRRAALEDNLSRADDLAFVTRDHQDRATYFNYHVSEDLYTSLRFHADRVGGWKSLVIDEKLAAMQSPQDIMTRTVQRFKYAGGSLDMLLRKLAPFQRGLSLPQRMLYGTTFFFYLSFLWNLVFLSVPAIFLLSGLSPINRSAGELLTFFLPYYVCLELAFIVGFWGQNTFKSRAWAMADFSVQLQAFWTVIRGREIKFTVTPKETIAGIHWHLIWPHMLFFAINLGAVLVAVGAWVMGSSDLFDGGRPFVLFWALYNTWAMWQPIGSGVMRG